MKTKLETVVGSDEKILYKGTPKKGCYILESIINPFLFFVIVWGLIDAFAIGAIINEGTEGLGFLIPFFCIHLMPVWIYLITVVFCLLRHSRVQYIVTDKAVYISGGMFSFSYVMKPFTELSPISLHRGIFDQICKCGDIVFDNINFNNSQQQIGRFAIINIAEYEEVFKLIKKLQTNVYSDTMFPNDLRPKQNHGYKTELVDDEKENGTN